MSKFKLALLLSTVICPGVQAQISSGFGSVSNATGGYFDSEGRFQLAIPKGRYASDLTRPNGEPMAGDMASEERENAAMGAHTVSAEELRHPLSSKGKKLIRKALAYMRANEHGKAILQLREALDEQTAAPYAHSLLGTEYLKTGQVQEATTQLEEAVRLLPSDPVNHSNLGYALLLTGNREQSETEARRALQLDPQSRAAQVVLDLLQPRR